MRPPKLFPAGTPTDHIRTSSSMARSRGPALSQHRQHPDCKNPLDDRPEKVRMMLVKAPSLQGPPATISKINNSADYSKLSKSRRKVFRGSTTRPRNLRSFVPAAGEGHWEVDFVKDAPQCACE